MSRRPTIIDVTRKAGVSLTALGLLSRTSPPARMEIRPIPRQAKAGRGKAGHAETLRARETGPVGAGLVRRAVPRFTGPAKVGRVSGLRGSPC
ncbi:hypothetical protein RNZ50_25810 [Paracoccaceae bacterium Fryx2]|nr:hypothetical protein [Paracoccaceae bacterium Fryx2]MDT8858379.1 hypothetical protein [Paracoccaceae bacterium Fryx2]